MRSSEIPISLTLNAVDRTLIFSHLTKILESAVFRKSQRHRDLLSCLVRFSLDAPGTEISERRVAVEIYGKSDDFDPSQDAVVRVEISRLRSSLKAFYADEGRDEPVVISIPKGSYVPIFRLGAGRLAVIDSTPQIETIPAPSNRPTVSGYGWKRVALAVVLVLALFMTLSWFVLHRFSTTFESLHVTELPGRQLQPSVSPDGSRVAFAWDAEGSSALQIYVKPTRGDSVTPLTFGKEPARSPAWSPDGQTIAYLQTLPQKSQAVMLVPAKGGTPRVVTTIGTNVVGIAWTPDSRNLIVPAGSGNHLLALFLVSVATGERRQVTPGDSYFHPAVSPDGRTLAFATDRQAEKLNAICTLPLGRDFLPEGPVNVLRETTSETTFWPTWSADGRFLFFTKQAAGKGTLFRVPAMGGQIQAVPETSGIIFGREISAGKFLLVRQREMVSLARVPPPSAESPVPAKPIPLFKAPEQDFDGALSPDGHGIAFNSGRGGERGFWLANADGTSPTRVEIPAGLQSRQPRWSPDGKYVYFWASSDGTAKQRARIFRVAAEDLAPHIVAEPLELDGAENTTPRISRDGRRLYFTSNRSGTFQIWRAPIEGGGAEAVSPPDEAWFHPVAEESTDGNYVYYTSTRGIWRFSPKTGASDLYLKVDGLGMQVSASGIYYDTPDAVAAGLVLFQPFAANSHPLTYTLGPHRAWSILPSEDGLLASLVRNESNLELFSPR